MMLTGINFCSWRKGHLICRNLLIFVAFEFEGYHGGDDVDYYVDDVFFLLMQSADDVNMMMVMMMMGITLELMVSSDLNLSNKASSTEIISGGI